MGSIGLNPERWSLYMAQRIPETLPAWVCFIVLLILVIPIANCQRTAVSTLTVAWMFQKEGDEAKMAFSKPWGLVFFSSFFTTKTARTTSPKRFVFFSCHRNGGLQKTCGAINPLQGDAHGTHFLSDVERRVLGLFGWFLPHGKNTNKKSGISGRNIKHLQLSWKTAWPCVCAWHFHVSRSKKAWTRFTLDALWGVVTWWNPAFLFSRLQNATHWVKG